MDFCRSDPYSIMALLFVSSILLYSTDYWKKSMIFLSNFLFISHPIRPFSTLVMPFLPPSLVLSSLLFVVLNNILTSCLTHRHHWTLFSSFFLHHYYDLIWKKSLITSNNFLRCFGHCTTI